MNGSSAGQSDTLPLTGERTVPDVPEENYWYRRHEAAYTHLLPWCQDAVVLEAGCGEGYGAALLALVARRVLALDYDAITVAHVARRYPHLGAVRANLAALPLGVSTVEVVTSLQVIEHLWDQQGFLAECVRVLRPRGRLLLSTPNRLTFSPGSPRSPGGKAPRNPFHARELAPDELTELVTTAGLQVERMFGLRHGPRLRELDAAHGGSLVAAQVAVALGGAEWPEDLRFDVAGVLTADFEVTETDVETALDLLVVALAP